MRILDLVRPINTQKKRELELELEAEKLRFKSSTERAATQLRTNVLERRWFREHPIESTMLILIGGYFVARWSSTRSRQRSTERHERLD